MTATGDKVERCFCGGAVRPLLRARFYVRGPEGGRADVDTILYRCRRCDLVIRDLDYTSDVAVTHYELSSYTQQARADDQRRAREPLFTWVHGLAAHHLGAPPRAVLDFGCAHGHLLDHCAARGATRTVGVEIAPRVVAALRASSPHEIHTSLLDPELPDAAFDAVFAIDSIYYVEGDPQRLLSALAAKVRPGGVLIVRTTSRNQLHRLWAASWHAVHGQWGRPAPVRRSVAGDAKLGFSERALRTRLAAAGLTPAATHRWERRRRTPLRAALEAAACALQRVSAGRIDLCPGIVMVARRSP